MKKKVFIAVFVSVASFCAAQIGTQTSPTCAHTAAYDNFNHKFLNPGLWTISSACYTSNGQDLECVREIANGKLRLSHRNFGQRDSDVDASVGSNAVKFADSSSIKSITTDLEVTDFQESSCPANPQIGAHANINATWFNTGSGLPEDDVVTVFGFGTQGATPEEHMIFGQILYHGNFTFLFLGTVTTGTPVNLAITWDQPNHQFLLSWTNRITHARTNATMPYSPLSDSTPATNPEKYLTVNTYPANCTSKATWVYIDARFDNVYVQH